MKRFVLMLLVLASCTEQEASQTTSETREPPYCQAPRSVAQLPKDLREASGIAVSRRYPDILWAHNDSGEPILFAIDTLGQLRSRVTVAAANSDWEDIAIAPCGDGSCLYIGAIGDNLQNRTDRAVLRVPEPELNGRATVDARFRYELKGGPQDVEALFVLPDERIFVISKGRSGAITLYAFPAQPSTSSVNILEPVQTLTPGLVQLPEMVTGAGVTPDGRTIVIRSYSALQLYTFDGQLKALLPVSGFDLQPLNEHQGEGVDINRNGTVFLVSEKGLGDDDPPLSRVDCVLSAR